MDYKQLSQQYIDDTIAENMYAREVEHFHYQLNIDTFNATIASLPDGEYKSMLQKRVAEEMAQQKIGEHAYLAMETLIKDPVAHNAAIRRVQQKREAAAALITKAP